MTKPHLYSIFYERTITFAVEKEIEKMVYAYLELLHLPLRNQSHLIDNLKELIGECENYLETKENLLNIQKIKIDLIRKTASFFLRIVLEYAKQKGMQNISF